MFETSSVFKRAEQHGAIISDRAYNLAIGLTLAWGFGVNYLIVTNVPVESIQAIPFFVLIIGYIVSCFAGIAIYSKSDNPAISFFGYNLIVVPMGIVITPLVHSFAPEVVKNAVMATGAVTVIMMCLSTMYPAFFKRIAGTLFVALIATIIVVLIMTFIFRARVGIFDWIIAAIFCGYIGYDWARANSIPKTLDNAVDSAASLYVDIINLFIRILAILGGNRD